MAEPLLDAALLRGANGNSYLISFMAGAAVIRLWNYEAGGNPSIYDLTKLANARMPFGKFEGRYLVDLPDAYYVWFKRQGFPEGELGQMLAAMHEIKTNGLERLLTPLRKF